MIKTIVFLITFLLFLNIANSQPQKKIALLIGCEKYKNITPLTKCKSDIDSLEKVFKKELGFEVLKYYNITSQIVNDSILDYFFNKKAINNDVVLVYLSGHGISHAGQPYYCTIDANIKNFTVFRETSVAIQDIMEYFRTRHENRKNLNFLIADMCMNSPFKISDRSLVDYDVIKSGFSPPSGSYIAFSTSNGFVAKDSFLDNGLFTQELLKEIRKCKAHTELFRDVRINVEKIAKESFIYNQSPDYHDKIDVLYYFNCDKEDKKTIPEEIPDIDIENIIDKYKQVKISAETVSHEVEYDTDKELLKFKISCEVFNAYNLNLRALIRFYDENENTLKDKNGKYCDQFGDVVSFGNFIPKYDKAEIRDIEVYIPKSELHLLMKQKLKIRYTIEILPAKRNGVELIEYINLDNDNQIFIIES